MERCKGYDHTLMGVCSLILKERKKSIGLR